ncbi:MAG: hypothetical protein QOI10_1794 [Solirubrobacterales bacterium]|nr:hypothetical protein [Solirubrobacterales bacterium]
MLFKAIIWEDRGTIQPKSGGDSFSFRECVGIVRGMGRIDDSEAVLAATIAGHRDAVQHQGAAVSEERLYIDSMSGLRLFDDLLDRMFGERLAEREGLAHRMLPIALTPPREFHLLTSNDVEHIRDLLKPPKRRHAEALAYLRTLVVSEQVAADPVADVRQPTERELERIAKKLQGTSDWTSVLPGLARLSLEHDEGAVYGLRIVKNKEAPAVKIVKPGEEGAEDAVSILRVGELDHWMFYLKDLASQAGITRHEALVLVHLLDLKADHENYRLMMMGKQAHGRYSHRALLLIREAKSAGRIEEAKTAYREHLRAKRRDEEAR